MTSVDDRVVNMKFNNAQFEAGVKQTLDSLSALNKGLKMEGATKGLEDLGNAGDKLHFGLSAITNGVNSIADRFKALSVVGITALTNIVNKAVDAGLSVAKSLTIEPVTSGLQEYELNLNSIQTILANTAVAGTKLKDVNAALDELNHYSDQTIYNFSEMTKNIGTFTAAGVDLKTSVEAIKGIANLAAISGSNSQQASTAMYQLSQAIASGKVSLEDWNSVVNAGMGGTVFQRALAQTAVAMGEINASAVKLVGPMQNVSINGQSFRDSIMAKPGEQSWLSSKVLLNTLKQFTGDLSNAELKAMGFKDAQIAAIQQMAQNAQHAATEVKTLSAVLDTAKEAAGSGWSETWRIIFGDFEEAKGLFTNVSNAINGFIGASADARNKVLKDWKDLGGRTSLIYAIENAFKAVMAILTPIKQAFRQIFPATTGQQLMNITTAIRMFTEKLIIGGQTADKIHRTFAGVFAVLDIGWTIIKRLAKVFFDLFKASGDGASSFLDITAKIGDFLVKVDVAIKQGTALNKFFDGMTKVLSAPIKFIGMLGSKLASMFDGVDTGGGSKFLNMLKKIWDFVEPLAKKVGDFFKSVGKSISDALSKLKFKDILNVLDTTAFAGIAVSIGLLVAKIRGLFSGGGGGDGFLAPIKEMFDGVTESLKSMQNSIKAATIIEIAIAIGLLTISMVALSKLNADQLVLSLSAIGIMMTELIVTMKQLEDVTSEKEIGKMIGLGIALTILAVAVDILAIAVKKLADLDWQGLAKGLLGLAGILAGLIATVKLMPDDKKLFATGIALLVLAGAVKVLVSAVTELAGLSWQDLAKGLIGVGLLLGGLLLFTKFSEVMPAGFKTGAGLLLLAVGIKILADAVSEIAKLSWEQIAKGLVGIAAGMLILIGAIDSIPPTAVLGGAGVLLISLSLVSMADNLKKLGGMSWGEIAKGLVALLGVLAIITAALYIIPPTAPLAAASILLVALALGDIANALKIFGDMSWSAIAKSLVELAGALTIIAIATTTMILALPGAAALLVVAASLAILAPILKQFGDMSWAEIGKSLLMLAGIFVILGVAGIVLAPVVPILLGLGIAITLLGIGMLAAGAGVFLFAAALTALSILGVGAVNNIFSMVSKLLDLIPLAMAKVGEGIIKFAEVIAVGGPAITAALTTVLLSLITAIDTVSPKIIDTLFKLLTKMYDKLVENVPHLVDAGLKILIGFLNGIANNIGMVVDKATDVIVAYINGIGRNLPRIIQAGINLIINFVNGLADGIRNNQDRMNAAGMNLAGAIIDGMVSGLGKGIGKVTEKAKEIAKAALSAAMHVLDAHSPSREFMKIGGWASEGLAIGIGDGKGAVATAAEIVGYHAMDTIRRTIAKASDAVSQEMDLNPRVTPVLDLTDVRDKAGQIGRILSGAREINLGATNTNANDASAGVQRNISAQVEDTMLANAPRETIQFNQYNSSPKPLNEAEIYRNTNNQLSRAKGALTPANA